MMAAMNPLPELPGSVPGLHAWLQWEQSLSLLFDGLKVIVAETQKVQLLMISINCANICLTYLFGEAFQIKGEVVSPFSFLLHV